VATADSTADHQSASATRDAAPQSRQDRTTQSVLDVARSVLSELDLDVVLNRVLDAAQELSDARYAALGVLNEEKNELSRFLTRGVDDARHTAIGQLPRGRGVLGALIADPAPLRLADVGEHPQSYGFPPGHPPMRTFLGVPILIRGEPFGNLYLTDKAGGAQFSEEDERSVAILADFAGVAIDHARRYTQASERRDELVRTNAALDATLQIARAVGGETDLGAVLELVAKRGRALVSARALVIELARGEELLVAAAAGQMRRALIGQRLPLADSLAGHAVRTERTQRLEEPLNRTRFREHGLGQLGVDAAGGLVVPLMFRGETHGVLIALDRLDDGPRFSADDELLLEAFATSAATAVATARSVTEERQRHRLAAAEGERQRWARELHDETLQSLSALRIALSGARRSGDSDAIQGAVGQALEHLEEAIANLRSLITDLRPAALDELGAQAALEALAERSARQGVEVDVSVELGYEQAVKSEGHAPELETAVYRIAQEALTNAIKHGNAKRAVIDIREEPGMVYLSVRDDGTGFDPDARAEGFGLLGMHERVALLGGELHIESAPGKGTAVRAQIPTHGSA
jgi:signal transduction histidine kinase